MYEYFDFYRQVSTKSESGVSKKKKRVSILPTVGSAESREVPRIVVPDVDSMELTRVPSSCDDLPSIGSEESLTAQDPQVRSVYILTFILIFFSNFRRPCEISKVVITILFL